MIFQIGYLILGDDAEDEHNPGPKSARWTKTNVVVEKPIPGKGNKTITIRTSDMVLDHCELVVRSITNDRYKQLKILCDECGPFKVKCNHCPDGLNMYIVGRTIDHAENDKEPPLRETETNEMLNVATWTISLCEAWD
ncbi:MAG: hypothetical protein WC455_30620 [Dehalococcoidia bacterium]|jgi:hypothetical protein